MARRTAKSPMEFVEIWQTAPTLEEAAQKSGCSPASAATRANAYRKKGVPLKELKKKGGFDVEALRRRAMELVNAGLANGGGNGAAPKPGGANGKPIQIPETVADHLAVHGPMKAFQIAKDLELSQQQVDGAIKTHGGWFAKGADGTLRLSTGGMSESRRRRGLET